MAKANLTLPNGATVQIEGTTEEVAGLLERFSGPPVAAAAARRSASPKRGKARDKPSKRRAKGVVDYVRELIAEDFFKTRRGLGDVKEALEERAHIYPVTTLSPAMFRLVRSGELRRLKEKGGGQWRYVNP